MLLESGRFRGDKKNKKKTTKIYASWLIYLKIAASSFCVYLFGLESLAANSEGFLFLGVLRWSVLERGGRGCCATRILVRSINIVRFLTPTQLHFVTLAA